MSKSVLVIDTPKTCKECKLFCHSWLVCVPSDEDVDEYINPSEGRLDSCPLRPLPQAREFGKRNILPIKVDGNSFILGWNAFRDEILGEVQWEQYD